MPDHSPDPTLSPAWTGLVDDAAIFPPGDAPLDEAVADHLARAPQWYAGLVGTLVLRDTDLDSVEPGPPLSIVVTTGAGAIGPALALAARRGHAVASIETALRDVDDLAGNARRVVAAVDAARAEGVLDDDIAVHVEIPADELPGDEDRVPFPLAAGWLAAADEVAAAELRLKFRTGGLDPSLFPSPARLAAQISAALDRETPFKCTAGLHHAVRHQDEETGWWHHGFLNVLLGTLAAWDGADVRTLQLLLGETDAGVLAADARGLGPDLVRARRWFTSFGSCSVLEPLDDLVSLDLAGVTA